MNSINFRFLWNNKVIQSERHNKLSKNGELRIVSLFETVGDQMKNEQKHKFKLCAVRKCLFAFKIHMHYSNRYQFLGKCYLNGFFIAKHSKGKRVRKYWGAQQLPTWWVQLACAFIGWLKSTCTLHIHNLHRSWILA